MSDLKIPNLEDLLQLDEKIVSTQIKCLTAPGENYGSLMLSVDITTETTDLQIVAKTLPPNPKMQEMFNCPVTFRNEIAFYKSIIPTLRSFQKEHGVKKVMNFAAKYYGSRPNLHHKDEKIDKDAVLLLENLKVSGFVNLERTEGFDLDTSKLILHDLAQLHGISIALKLQEPKIFKQLVQPLMESLSVSKEVLDDWEDKYLKIIHSIPRLEPYLDRLKKVNLDIYPPPPAREPFATVSHNDCWVNNTMVQLQNGKAVQSRLVDFQISDYASPAKDVLFFLFSSIKNDILRKECDNLIRYYHDNLIEVLKELKCDTQPFCFEEFQKELDFEAVRTQFAHLALMLFPIFAPKLDVKDMADIKPSDIGNNEPTELHKEKLVFIVEEFAKRAWI
ncbi:hypothetical protein Zmor_010126 [Zophobas morio]|uniref:CHK kinase-like domain-containing protein n=1 Tax=Zophobas morio TaxID=2755281 RepID=A0AA38MJF2_9CUCU|nr:hypothetical protein Zmor_010126 [Zophobas morio]